MKTRLSLLIGCFGVLCWPLLGDAQIIPGNPWIRSGATIQPQTGVTQVLGPDGSASAPAGSYINDTNTGRYRIGANNEGLTADGVLRLDYNPTRLNLSDGYGLQFDGGATLFDDGAQLVSLRNSTNAQELRIENTFTDTSNREFVSLGFINNANVFTIQTEAAGTGTVRNMALMGGQIGVGTATPNLASHDRVITVMGGGGGTGAIELGRTLSDTDGGAYGDYTVVHGNTTATEKRLFIIRGSTDGATANNRGGRTTFFLKNDGGSGFTEVLQLTTGSVRAAATDNTIDLGTSSLRWQIGYFGTALAIGTNPASAGAVRLANAAWLAGRNAGNTADVNMLRVDTNNRVQVGPGDVPVKVGIAVNSVAAAAAEDGGLMIATTDNTLIYYSGGARYKIVGVSF